MSVKFDDLLKEQLQDPEIKKEYDDLQPERAIIQALIDARLQTGMTQKELSELSSCFVFCSPSYSGTGEHGNSIDFLTRYFNFSFADTVTTLCRIRAHSFNATAGTKQFSLPQQAERPFGKVVKYLTGRGIPENLVIYLIQEGLLYQDLCGNAVFVDLDESYCEIRGTGVGNHFHGCRKKASDRFWYFLTESKPEAVYICEAAIDALSLMLIHQKEGKNEPAAYVSIGGVANQRTIDRLKRKHGVVLAVDNDQAGKEARKRNPDLPVLIPEGKDWSEDLQRNRYS